MSRVDRLLASVDRTRRLVLCGPSRAGARNRVFDGLVLCGPLSILLIALVGRTVLTTVLAALYLLTFVAYVLYEGTRDGRGRFVQ